MPLEEYRRRRNAARTPEPVPAEAETKEAREDTHIFVIQEHHARALHWDFRLERDGVLVSWAVPKGPPGDPGHDHFARQTEDHPMAYAEFSGTIPRGEYGAGTVTIWDRGRYEVVKWTDREIKIILHGRRTKGGYTLYRTRGEDWMLHRERITPPEWVAPMMAVAAALPPQKEDDAGLWDYEMKWDGVRASAYLEKGRLTRLISRTGRDITGTYPELCALGPATKDHQLVLDGEIVAFAAGRPSFEALQPRMHVSDAAEAARLARHTPVTFLVFDLLHLDWRPTLDLPYRQRRELLDGLGLAGPAWQVPPAFTDAAGADVLAAAVAQGLEGVVAKRAESRYLPGKRTADWRKVKPDFRQEAVVGGINPGKGRREGLIGSLLIGVQAADGSGLAFAGRVGTGLNDEDLRMLGAQLEPLHTKENPFVTPVPRDQARVAQWVQPRLVVEVAFAGWTKEGRMRAPSYRGLRTDKDPADVVREY